MNPSLLSQEAILPLSSIQAINDTSLALEKTGLSIFTDIMTNYSSPPNVDLSSGSPTSSFTSPSSSSFLSTSSIYDALNYWYNDFWQEEGDARVAGYPFMQGGPWSTIAMIGAYLYVIKVLGPELMRDRKPFDLRWLMVIYNFAMVILSAYLVYEGGFVTGWGIGAWRCQEVDHNSYSPEDIRTIRAGWIYFASKFVEFLDTIFFVMRKKNSQVSMLHVIHHASVPLSVWIGLKFAPGGNNAFFPWLNSIVHTVMYAYYGLSALGPRVQPYLWWKRYITTIQITQFMIAIAHGLRAFFMPSCRFPRSFLMLNLSNAVLFLFLFQSFYRQAYLKKKPEAADKKMKEDKKDDLLMGKAKNFANELNCQILNNNEIKMKSA